MNRALRGGALTSHQGRGQNTPPGARPNVLEGLVIRDSELVVVAAGPDRNAHRGEHSPHRTGGDLLMDAVGVLVTRGDPARVGELGQDRGDDVIRSHAIHCATGRADDAPVDGNGPHSATWDRTT